MSIQGGAVLDRHRKEHRQLGIVDGGGILSVDGVTNPGGNIDLIAGTGMTITPDDGANTITFEASAGVISAYPVMSWVGNGPFATGTSVDGGRIINRAATIEAIWLWRGTAGASGSTVVDIHKNGTTIYTTQGNRPTIAFDDADNKVQATTPDITSIAAGDVLTLDIDSIEGGVPQNIAVIITYTTSTTAYPILAWLGNGNYTVDTNVDGGRIVNRALNIDGVYLWRGTAGTSSSTIVDINKNGTTMYTTQANRPTIAWNDADNKVLATNPDVVAAAVGDIITVDIDQVEAGTPGNLAVIITVTTA